MVRLTPGFQRGRLCWEGLAFRGEVWLLWVSRLSRYAWSYGQAQGAVYPHAPRFADDRQDWITKIRRKWALNIRTALRRTGLPCTHGQVNSHPKEDALVCISALLNPLSQNPPVTQSFLAHRASQSQRVLPRRWRTCYHGIKLQLQRKHNARLVSSDLGNRQLETPLLGGS